MNMRKDTVINIGMTTDTAIVNNDQFGYLALNHLALPFMNRGGVVSGPRVLYTYNGNTISCLEVIIILSVLPNTNKYA